MKNIVSDPYKDKDTFDWINWLNNSWNNYEAFVDFDAGNNPKEVANNFFDLNQNEFEQLFESLDNEDIEIIDQLYKLSESELHLFKILKGRINSKNKVKFVDFKRK